MWKCICGKTSNYDGLMDAVRFWTQPKHCIQCGNIMHIKTTTF